MAKDGKSFDLEDHHHGSEDLHQLLDRHGALREEARLQIPEEVCAEKLKTTAPRNR